MAQTKVFPCKAKGCSGSHQMYRITRNLPYAEGTPGHTDPSARQGYYFQAHSETEAVLQMAKTFHTREDILAGFKVQLWADYSN